MLTVFSFISLGSHCWACKLQSGAEGTLNTLVPRDAFNLTKGELKQYTYTGDSGSPVHCFYCATCTTNPYHHQTVRGPDTLVIRTMLLAGAKDWPVAAQVYGKDRLHWMPEVATTFEVGPPS